MVTRRLRQPRTVKTDSGFSAEFEIFFGSCQIFPRWLSAMRRALSSAYRHRLAVVAVGAQADDGLHSPYPVLIALRAEP
jgi:hypothetical protein